MAGGFSSSSSATTIETSPSLRITAICLLILANSLFAGWDIIIREFYALSPHPFHPILFNVVRGALSGIINVCIALYFEGTDITIVPINKFKFDHSRFLENILTTKNKRRLAIIFTSVVGIFVAQVGYLYGVKFTSATHGAVLQPLIAVVAMLIAIFAGAEKFGSGVEAKKKIYGLILCVGGAMVVVLGSNHHKRHHAVTASSGTKSRIPNDAAAKTYPILGTALILFEVLGVALFYVILPVLSRFYKSAWLTSMVILSSLPVYILTFFLFIEIEPLDKKQLIINKELVYSMSYCVMNTIFFNFAIVWGSKHLEASFASLFACSHPVATSILSVLILKHPISIYDFVGGILIIFGFYQSTQAKLKGKKFHDMGNEFDVDVEKLGSKKRRKKRKEKKFKPYRDGTISSSGSSSSSSDDDEIGDLNDNDDYESDVSL